MRTLAINQFRGTETVNKNKSLLTNAAFYSKLKSFEGKLSSSHYVVKFPIAGVENYYTLNKKIQIDCNSYMVTNPHVEIEGFVKSTTDVIGICIGFTEEYLNDLASSIGQNMNLCLDNPLINSTSKLDFFTKKNRINNDTFGFMLQSIKQNLLNKTINGNYQEDQFYITFGEYLLKSELDIHSKISSLPRSKMSTREEIYRRIEVMNQFIHDNFKEDISLEDLSKESSLSKYHAVRCYQNFYGVSPYQKILSLRIEKAKELLKKGYNIKEVALEVNFTDHRALSKAFKRKFNLTPSQYKQKALS